mmetsp:Transcript_44301/g.128091  ORF Transcript_44301/g.128091 Transcript_44301/m.128091 type:complete len:225 (+) Transcript_44301:203-877(+)
MPLLPPPRQLLQACCCEKTAVDSEQRLATADVFAISATDAVSAEGGATAEVVARHEGGADLCLDTPPHASACSSYPSSRASPSSAAQEREKARLHHLLKDFAKEAVSGLLVVVVCPKTGQRSPHFLQMDRNLTLFSLQPQDRAGKGVVDAQAFNIKDLTRIYKGPDVEATAPWLGGIAQTCVAMDTQRADRRLLLAFEDPSEQDKFYTCLKILRMSVDIGRTSA